MNDFETFLSGVEASVAEGAQEARSTKLRPKKTATASGSSLAQVREWCISLVRRELPAACARYGLEMNEELADFVGRYMRLVWDGRKETAASCINRAAAAALRTRLGR
jgi:hypothetical protein